MRYKKDNKLIFYLHLNSNVNRIFSNNIQRDSLILKIYEFSNWKEIVRKTLQRNCQQLRKTKNYQNKKNSVRDVAKDN